MPLFLVDRRGNAHELSFIAGEPLAYALVRNGVPPPSVIIVRDNGAIISDHESIEPTSIYEAQLIEGYDIAGILERTRLCPPDGGSYTHRRLRIDATGALRMEQRHLREADIIDVVESTVAQTVDRFKLINPGERVVLGLSGGVDSSSLLMLLEAAGMRAGGNGSFQLVAATFEDFDSRYSETFAAAAALASRHGVEHHILDPGMAEKVFHLQRPIAQILMLLMETDDAHQAMYVDHHTTRRVLEVFADSIHSPVIALGLHTTDLLAGLLNAATSGMDMGRIPERTVGPYRYIFPLSFVPKRELHLYYTARTGHLPKQTVPNQWEFNPADRNYYYYLADMLQWHWPGVESWMFSGHNRRAGSQSLFEICDNCGASTRKQPGVTDSAALCDVCALLDRYAWLSK
jgi:tRNA(Ile)-lysidine synthase TilS/MesJ